VARHERVHGGLEPLNGTPPAVVLLGHCSPPSRVVHEAAASRDVGHSERDQAATLLGRIEPCGTTPSAGASSYVRSASTAPLTRSGTYGPPGSRPPVASQPALPSAAGTAAAAGSPTPRGGSSRRWIISSSIGGTSSNRRIG